MCEKWPVYALVNDAEIAQTRVRQVDVVFRFRKPIECRPEVLGLDRRREKVNVRMPPLFSAIEARPSGEDDICPLQELPLALYKVCRRKVKGGEFVHTVVDDDLGLEKLGERQRHRSIHP